MKFSFKRVFQPYLALGKCEFHWLMYLHHYTGVEKYTVVMSTRLIHKFIKACSEQGGVEYSESHARNSFYRLAKAGFLEKSNAKGTYTFNQTYFNYE